MSELTWELLCELSPTDSDYFEGWRLLDEKQVGTWRWGYMQRYILQRESDGKTFRLTLNITSGDNGPGFDADEILTPNREVRPVEKTVIDWVDVE